MILKEASAEAPERPGRLRTAGLIVSCFLCVQVRPLKPPDIRVRLRFDSFLPFQESRPQSKYPDCLEARFVFFSSYFCLVFSSRSAGADPSHYIIPAVGISPNWRLNLPLFLKKKTNLRHQRLTLLFFLLSSLCIQQDLMQPRAAKWRSRKRETLRLF